MKMPTFDIKNDIFRKKILLFIKMSCKFLLCRLNDNGAYKIQILARKIGSLNCSLLFQRNGKGTTVPLLRNEERNAFFFSNLERRTERVPFFSKERGTERVPEIRGTTKALLRCKNSLFQSLKYEITKEIPRIQQCVKCCSVS